MKLTYRTGQIATGSAWTDREEQTFATLLILLDRQEARMGILLAGIQATDELMRAERSA